MTEVRETGRAGVAIAMLGFLVLWIVLDRSAAALGSLRGEAGLAVCAAVLALAVAIEAALSRHGPVGALGSLGLGVARSRALLWALALSLAIVSALPAYSAATGARIELRAGWIILAIGMFAQGGIAEEIVFRGFLFRRLRSGRSFWRAALLAAVPFVAVHLVLFLTLDFVVALAATMVSLSISFPLAWLFERAGGSVWPCAVVHFAVQAPIKIIEIGDAAFAGLAIMWMVVGALAPWTLFLLRPRPGED